MVKREVYCGDSWFTNYQTVECMSLHGFHYFGQVKTGFSKIPKDFLEREMEFYCPGSWLVLEHTSDSGVEMVCIGYKYSRGKVNTYLMSKGCGNTSPGPVYRTTYTTENGEKVHRDVGRPEVVTQYYAAAGVIDHHNHSRQGTLALEKRWPSTCGWFRIWTTMVGITVTDAWMGLRHHIDKYPKDNARNRHKWWNLSEQEFAELVAASILRHNSKVRFDVTHDSLPLLDDDEQDETSENDIITSPETSRRSRTDGARAGSVTVGISDTTTTVGPI